MYYFHDNVDGAVATPPAAETGGTGVYATDLRYPTNGNPGSGIPATDWTAYAAHSITAELLNLVVQAGITPALNDNTQVYDAVMALIAGASGGAGASGKNSITGNPVSWVSATQVKIPAGTVVRDSTNAQNITFGSDVTVAITSSGYNGLDPADTEGTNQILYLYAIADSNGVNPVGGMLSDNYSLTAGGLPSGYDLLRRLPVFLFNNSSSDLEPFKIQGGWPVAPVVKFKNWENHNLIMDGTATTPTAVSLSTWRPDNSNTFIHTSENKGAGTFCYFRTESADAVYARIGENDDQWSNDVVQPISLGTDNFYYNNSGGAVRTWLGGFIIDNNN